MLQRMSVVVQVLFNEQRFTERYLVRKKMYSIVVELLGLPKRLFTRAISGVVASKLKKIKPTAVIRNFTKTK
jgi:hypothetical protein